MKTPQVRGFQFILLAATAVLVVVFYFQTQLMDLDRHNAEAQALLNLKQLDTLMEEEALKAVALQISHYDSLAEVVAQTKSISSTLNDPVIGVYGLISPKMDKDIDLFLDLMATKIDLLEALKSRTSIVRNTLNFLPMEVQRQTRDRHEEVDIELNRLLGALLSENLNPGDFTHKEVLRLFDVLEHMPITEERRVVVERILKHARANLKANNDVNALMDEFLSLPTIRTLERILGAHTEFSLSRIRQANQYRSVLLVLSLLLFVGLGVTLTRLRQARTAAERTSRQFRDAAESINEGFAFFDSDGRLQFWNKTFERLHAGCGDALSTGAQFLDFFNACVECGVYEQIVLGKDAQKTNSDGTYDHPYVIKSRDGSWVLASDSPMGDGGTASVRVDITDSKHAEEELRKLSRAVEQSPATVVITDIDGTITYVNPKFCETTGYSPEEAIGQKPSLVSSGERSKEDYEGLWDTITAGKEWRGEFHNQRKDGSLFWEYASISAIKDEDGAISHYLAVKEDVTERKDNVAQLIKAKEEAELASHAKTQFLANMSHELRTPLNAIIGFSEIIKGQMFGPIENASYVEYSDNIHTSGKHLLDVINDILDVSRIETGTMEIRESDVDFRALAQSCLDMVREQAEHGKLDLTSELPEDLPLILGDEIRLKQIMINLLTNAVKFTPEGGEVGLDAFINDDGSLTLHVKDTGFGIPEDQHLNILEPFEQVSDIYSRNHEGSGLGLYLVNSFVKLHEGELSIESAVDQGTTVTVVLPAARTLKG
ncbi:PAS domain S-box protein [Pseudomonadota bacterium]